jgi:hypothetical protein
VREVTMTKLACVPVMGNPGERFLLVWCSFSLGVPFSYASSSEKRSRAEARERVVVPHRWASLLRLTRDTGKAKPHEIG